MSNCVVPSWRIPFHVANHHEPLPVRRLARAGLLRTVWLQRVRPASTVRWITAFKWAPDAATTSAVSTESALVAALFLRKRRWIRSRSLLVAVSSRYPSIKRWNRNATQNQDGVRRRAAANWISCFRKYKTAWRTGLVTDRQWPSCRYLVKRTHSTY